MRVELGAKNGASRPIHYSRRTQQPFPLTSGEGTKGSFHIFLRHRKTAEVYKSQKWGISSLSILKGTLARDFRPQCVFH